MQRVWTGSFIFREALQKYEMKLRDFLKEKPLISSSPSAAEEPVSIHQFVPTHAQPVFSCSKLTIETLKHGVKYVQS